MHVIKRFLSLALLVFAAVPAWAAHTQVSLLLSAQTARPGDTILAGVRLEMEPGWHTYWRNPGPAGMATTLTWDLPTGIAAGAPQWPAPEKVPDPEFTTYVYSGEVVLLVPLKLSADLHPGPVNLKLKASWLECSQSCIPGDGTAEAQLTIGPETKLSQDATVLEGWQKRLPQPAAPLAVRAWWNGPATKDLRSFTLEWNTPTPITAADFYPDASEHWEVQGPTTNAPAPSGKTALSKGVKKSSGDWPKRISGVLVQKVGNEQHAYEVDVPLNSAPVAAAAPLVQTAPVSLWLALVEAFFGGFILNAFPCVLPVIALKILGFVNQAKGHPRQVRVLGLIYTLGVLASFLVLALLVIAIKAAGSAAGWGFQFGNPYFLVAMTTLATLVALNLFGVFEVTLSGGAMSAASTLSAKHGPAGAFFNGLLTTVLATSCSAPLLGPAIGFAFAQGPALILLIMLTIGLGLSAPYLLLSWNPQWLRFLPKPGAWMEKFKVLMGFPMLGAAVWIYSNLDTHYGSNAWWMLVFLAFVALSVWIYGEFVQRGRRHRGLAAALAVVFLLTGYLWALEYGLQWRRPPTEVAGTGRAPESPEGIDWQDWSPQAVADAQKAGQPVLIDFTAKWCLTCNTIIKPALESAAVVAKLKALNARALIANYTRQPPAITAELKRFGRAGVPLVVIYPRNPSKPPMVFDVVTSGSLLTALDQAAAP